MCTQQSANFFLFASKHTAFSLAALNNKQLIFFLFPSSFFLYSFIHSRIEATVAQANVQWPKKSWLKKTMHTSNVYFRSLVRSTVRDAMIAERRTFGVGFSHICAVLYYAIWILFVGKFAYSNSNQQICSHQLLFDVHACAHLHYFPLLAAWPLSSSSTSSCLLRLSLYAFRPIFILIRDFFPVQA